jgi:hypothetical protein
MSSISFENGELVFLTKGTYAGTRGTFLKLRTDPNWADVREDNGRIREHPLGWLGRRVEGQENDFHVPL